MTPDEVAEPPAEGADDAPAGPPGSEGAATSRSAVDWRGVGWRALHWVGVLLVVVTGASVGSLLAPSTPAQVGPLLLDVRVLPSLHPGVVLLLPPAGRVDFDTHVAPVVVQARVSEVDIDAARELLQDPRGVAGLQAVAPDALRTATLRASVTTGVCALAGACVLSVVVYRRVWRRTAQVAAGLVGVLVATGLVTVATFDADRLAQPHFTGLLSRAPYIATQAGGLLDRLESYRSGLADIVQGVTALYATSDALPVLPQAVGGDLVTVLHVSDVHLNPLAFDLMDRLVEQFDVDVVADTGDITTWGTEVEGTTLSRIGRLKVPYVFVRGNHDSRLTQAEVAANRNAVVLDGDVKRVGGLVFAGIGDPTFTPDAGAELSAATPGVARTSGTTSATATRTPPPGSTAPAAAGTRSGDPTGTPTGAPTVSPTVGDAQPAADPQERVGQRLADVVRDWDRAEPTSPVDVALVHEPASMPPLLGTVPVVLAGHLHRRVVRVDESGTMTMVEGSTGGAGITAGTVDRLTEGQPVPLSATILYLSRQDGRARVVAYDEVTVGGFGLASVSLERTVVRADEVPAPPSPGATPSSGASVEPAAGSTGTPSPRDPAVAPAARPTLREPPRTRARSPVSPVSPTSRA